MTEPKRPASAVPMDGLAGHALYLDIDGTILDLAPTPDAVQVPSWLVPLLQRLRVRLQGAVAFVSGRPIAVIDALFRPLQLPSIGVHGGEIRTEHATVTPDPELSERLQRLEPFLRAALAALPAVTLENKRSAMALHYRAAPERGREVLGVAELALAQLGSEFGVVVGKCVVEIRARRHTKAEGIRHLMQAAPFQGRTPIFAGDDISDEDAFEFVNGVGGISVRVGVGGPTAATCSLRDPDALRGWLLEIAA